MGLLDIDTLTIPAESVGLNPNGRIKAITKGEIMSNFAAPVLSRRTLLTASAAGLVLPAPVLSMTSASAQGGKAALVEFNVSSSSFSVAERDRRWSAVRAVMARPQWNLDAIITAISDESGNYARYLTQVGGRPGSEGAAEVIFPRDPAQSVYVQLGQARNRDVWKARDKDWVADGKLTISEEAGPQALAKQMESRGLNRPGARIGVARLSGSRFNESGSVSAVYLDKLRAALPGVTFLPIDNWGMDAGPVEEAAMIKSPEEQAVVRRAVAASEQGVAAIVAAAQAGAKQQADIWFATYTAMFAKTGEDPSRISISLDQPGNSTLGEPTTDPVRAGQIVTEELDGTVQGYRAQVNHSIFIGGPATPGYDYYRACIEAAATLLKEAPSWVTPGKTTCGDFVKRYMARVEELGAEDSSGVMFHSSGIGSLTRPRLGPKNGAKDHEIVIRPGMTFDFKPALHINRAKMADVGAKNRDVQLGEHFLVTEQGMVRLGSRALAPLATQS
jgi:Xaa-Pro aminopeptidase